MNKKKLKLIFLIALLITVVGFVVYFSRSNWDVDQIKTFFNDLKDEPYLPVLYVLFYIVAVVFALPGAALTLISGPLFGFSKGFILVIIGANIGCQLTFFISRFLAYDFVQRKMNKYDKMAQLSQKIEEQGFSYLFYIRLLPIFPFNLINYLMGMTSISYKSYTLASFLGMLPGIAFYVYLSTQVLNANKSILSFIWPFALALIFFTAQRIIIKRKNKE